jgi:glycosyltransferase involved in cell wall biosynthesis
MAHVEIITPAFNAASTIEETIASVLAQTHADWTLRVVDDGSTDGTAEAVGRFLGDARISLIRQENRGSANARNRGLEGTTGESIAFLDADDVWEPRFLERLLPVLNGDPEVGLVWCDMALRGESTTGTYRGDRTPIAGRADETIPAIYRSVTFLPSCSLFRARFFRDGLRWSQEHAPMEDMPIFLHMALRSRIAHVDEVLASYRIHPASMTSSRGAVFRNRKAMLFTFRDLYRSYRTHISHREYRQRLWWILHHAADGEVRDGRKGTLLLLRALLYRPTAAVTWKVLVQSLLRT